MSTEDNKAIVQRFFEEVFNEKRVDRSNEFVAQDYLDHAAVPGQGSGLEGARSSAGRGTLPPSPICPRRLTRLVAEGDKLTVHYTVEGTRAVRTAGRPGHREALPGQWHRHLPSGRGEDRGELGADRSAGRDAAAGRDSCTWISQLALFRGHVLCSFRATIGGDILPQLLLRDCHLPSRGEQTFGESPKPIYR